MKAVSRIAEYKKSISKEWSIVIDKYSVGEEANEETLLTLCNGYAGCRGSVELPSMNKQQAVYLAGVYDKPDRTDHSEVFGLTIQNKAITPSYAIAPVYNLVEIYVDGNRIDIANCTVKKYQRCLDMKRGILLSEYHLEDCKGRVTVIETVNMLSKVEQHLAIMKLELTAVNYSGNISVRFINKQSTDPQYIPRIKDYTSKTDILEMGPANQSVYLNGRVSETGIDLLLNAQTISEEEKYIERDFNSISEVFIKSIRENQTLSFSKYVCIYTGRDTENPLESAKSALKKYIEIGECKLFQSHFDYWARSWSLADVEVKGDDEAQLGIRWNIFNLIQLGTEHDDNSSISATGLHGQGYFGHVFWDTEIFMLPFYLATNLDVAKNLLLYRYNRLDAARELAAEKGFQGAKFPWTSTWKGYDVTPPDWERCANRQIHISGDVAYGFSNYLTWTGDMEFYTNYGVEVIVETAKLYASRATKSDDGKYHILDVIGPDEYNIHADDNYYTNNLAVWNMKRAISDMTMLKEDNTEAYQRIAEKTGWNEEVEKRLVDVAENMAFPVTKDNVNEQYSGFFMLKNPDEIMRDEYYMPVDREYQYDAGTQVLKQADVVMMQYLFPDEFSEEVKKASFEYYEKRCNHGSSLSPSIHCIAGIRAGFSKNAYGYLVLTALLDLKNLHLDKNLKEGIHAACAGGTWAAMVYGFGGVNITKNQIHINPVLPDQWNTIQFSFMFRNAIFKVRISKDEMTIRTEADESQKIYIKGTEYMLEPAVDHVVKGLY